MGVFPTVSAVEISNAARTVPPAAAPGIRGLADGERVGDGHDVPCGFCGRQGRGWKNVSAGARGRGGER